jgi:hypothetical protein
MREQEINWDWSTKNIFEQNEKSERFDDMLIEKAKCIKKHVSGFCTLQVYQGLELDLIELDLSSFTHT